MIFANFENNKEAGFVKIGEFTLAIIFVNFPKN